MTTTSVFETTTPASISPHEQAMLRKFFTKGQNIFERSAFGGMYDRALHYAVDQYDKPIGFGQRWWEVNPYDVNENKRAQVHEVGGYTPEHEMLELVATMSRRLRRLSAVQPPAPPHDAVLEAIWGPRGMSWDGTKYGRLFAIFPWTQAGREWLKVDKSPFDNPPDVRLATACGILAIEGQQQRVKWKDAYRASQEAEALLAAACIAWNQTR